MNLNTLFLPRFANTTHTVSVKLSYLCCDRRKERNIFDTAISKTNGTFLMQKLAGCNEQYSAFHNARPLDHEACIVGLWTDLELNT